MVSYKNFDSCQITKAIFLFILTLVQSIDGMAFLIATNNSDTCQNEKKNNITILADLSQYFDKLWKSGQLSKYKRNYFFTLNRCWFTKAVIKSCPAGCNNYNNNWQLSNWKKIVVSHDTTRCHCENVADVCKCHILINGKNNFIKNLTAVTKFLS